MIEKLEKLKKILAKVADLNYATAVLDWDQQVYMPEEGDQERSEQVSTILEISHNLFVSDEVGKLLADLQSETAGLDPNSNEARLIKVTQREYDKETKIPVELLVKLSQATSVAHNAWVKAKTNNDFKSFQPHLETIIALTRQKAECFQPYEHIYDALLDAYEPGMLTSAVKKIFSELRPQQVELIKSIGKSRQVDDSFLRVKYDPAKQWQFGVEVAEAFGIDWKRSRQDKTEHPFTTSFGQKDVRITTNVSETLPTSAFFSTIHEAGHALYELGFSPELRRTPLNSSASLGFHESQSRMWENLVGRSRQFWSHFFPKFKAAFPQQLSGVDLETFYHAINKVEPSFIRTEADEATYNLHVMLRFEMELDLIEGKLKTEHVPEAWNDRMKDYLGVVPPTDTVGVLQDVHWSAGLIGYFPTYAIGNLISAQLWEKMHSDMPSLDDRISQGNFVELLNWLRTNIHQHGAKYEPQELIQMITGSKIDARPYIKYLQTKYQDIYQ
jgi:carboxypeptidase Taq